MIMCDRWMMYIKNREYADDIDHSLGGFCSLRRPVLDCDSNQLYDQSHAKLSGGQKLTI